jgi:hypothetical protein
VVVASGCGGDDEKPDAKPPARIAGLPADFVGLVAEDVFAGDEPTRDKLLDDQRDLGVQLIRQTFDWSKIETRPGKYDFAFYDAYVAATARHGMRLLADLFRPPPFRSSAPPNAPPEHGTYPPADPRDMGRFAAAVVRRYGPRGTFWSEQLAVPKLPIRTWQVWNEPNLPAYWGGSPSAPEDAALLREVSAQIKRVDPDAEVVTGGIPNSRLGVPLERYLRDLLDAGAARSFDTLAIHPYSATDAGLLKALADVRRTLRRRGHVDVPIWVTEFGWASGGPGSDFTVGAARQAQQLGDAIIGLAHRRKELGVRGFVYFNYKDAPPYAGGKDFWGLHTGLREIDGKPKPAFEAYRVAVRTLRRSAG